MNNNKLNKKYCHSKKLLVHRFVDELVIMNDIMWNEFMIDENINKVDNKHFYSSTDVIKKI